MKNKTANSTLLYKMNDAEEELRRLVQQEINERKINPRHALPMSILSGTTSANDNEDEGPWTYMTAVLRRIDAEVDSCRKRELELKEKTAEKNLNQQHARELESLKDFQQKELTLLKADHETQIQEQLQSHKAARVDFEATAREEVKVIKIKHKSDLHEAKKTDKVESKKEWQEFLANLSISQKGESEPIKVKQARENYELVLIHAQQLKNLELRYQSDLKLDPSNKDELRANYLWDRAELMDAHKQEIADQKFMHRQELRDRSEIPKEKIKSQKLERHQSLEQIYKSSLAEIFSIQFTKRADLKSNQVNEQKELILKLAHEIITKQLSQEQVLADTLNRHKKELSELHERSELFHEFKGSIPRPEPKMGGKKHDDEDDVQYQSPTRRK